MSVPKSVVRGRIVLSAEVAIALSGNPVLSAAKPGRGPRLNVSVRAWAASGYAAMVAAISQQNMTVRSLRFVARTLISWF